MKKTRQYSLLAIVLAVSLLSSCTQDDDSSRSSVSPALEKGIVVSVSDGLYGSQGGTRAIPNGMETVFEQGDAIGVFAVDAEGKVVRSNVKYVCNGVNWNVDATTTVPVLFSNEYSYYAYYPYQADLSELAAGIAEGETVAASTADAFFEELTANWEVKDNQKAKADYVASDLMVAKGVPNATVGDFAIDFNMTHQMGLVLLSFGEMTRMVDASITWKEPVTQTCKGETQPYVWNGIGRYIFNPASTTAKLFTASDDSWIQAVRMSERGHYKEYKIEATKSYTLAVGDIVWTDGSFSKTVEYDKFYDKRPMGVIGYLGNDDVVDGITDANGKRRYTHGIIVGTWAIKNRFANATSYNLYGEDPELFVNCNRYSLCHYDYCGLEKTRWMQEKNTDGVKYELANLVKNYGKPVPEYNNSGWYVGSIGQWEGIIRQMCNSAINFASLNNEIGNAVDNYKWSWVGNFRTFMSKVGYEYYWPYDGNTTNFWAVNDAIIGTSSVHSTGIFAAVRSVRDDRNVGGRYLYYAKISMTEGNVFTFPIISF